MSSVLRKTSGRFSGLSSSKKILFVLENFIHIFEYGTNYFVCRANRPKSYISRTVGWEQYPHGRWSDSKNPSYGALTDHQVII